MPIPGKTFQTCNVLAINKTVKQSNPLLENSQHYLKSLSYENTTKCAQGVHRFVIATIAAIVLLVANEIVLR